MTGLLKRISLLLIVALLTQSCSMPKAETPKPISAPQLDSNLRFDDLLGEIKATLVSSREQTLKAPDHGFAQIDKLRSLRGQLDSERQKVLDYQRGTGEFLAAKGLSPEIQQRNIDSMKQFRGDWDELGTALDAIEQAHANTSGLWKTTPDWKPLIDRAVTFIDTHTAKQPEQKIDPNNLPHRVLHADPIKPKETKAEWDKFFAEQIQKLPDNMFGPPVAHAAEAQVLSTTPTPEDLAETIEVKFTPDITALATQLNHNPVQIYNWVHNNIEFVPTWGSIQGAQLCLETKACNAFDTSSLLIALLRVSGIPARYQMGTIEVPADKFMNWAGGFTDLSAAASLFASGGVPSVVRRLNQDTGEQSVRLEHVWVKAFVDYIPSQGAVNKEGDTWVELDGGWKQYSFVSPINLSDFRSFNTVEQLALLFPRNSISLDRRTISSIDVSKIDQYFGSDNTAILSRIQQNNADASFRELAGGIKIINESEKVLSGMFNHVIIRDSNTNEINDSLRYRITINILGVDGRVVSSFSQSLPSISGKSIFVEYRPSRDIDVSTLSNSLPTDVSSPYPVKWFISGIMISPVIKVDNEVVGQGDSVMLGSSQEYEININSPSLGSYHTLNTIKAGENQSIVINHQRVKNSVIDPINRQIEAQSALAGDGNWRGMSFTRIREMEMAYIGAMWFVQDDMISDMVSWSFNVRTVRMPSVAVVYSALYIESVFGLPVSLQLGGYSMDIDNDIVVSSSRDNNIRNSVYANIVSGIFGSALESATPSELTWGDYNMRSWVSTSIALGVALQKSIPVTSIDLSNKDKIDGLPLSNETKSEIMDGVSEGMTAIILSNSINNLNKAIDAYILIDLSSGSGSYIVAGSGGGKLLDEAAEQNPKVRVMMQVYDLAWETAKTKATDEAAKFIFEKLGASDANDLLGKTKSFKGYLDTVLRIATDIQAKEEYYDNQVIKYGESVRPLAGLLFMVGALKVMSDLYEGPGSSALTQFTTALSSTSLRIFEISMISFTRTQREADANGLNLNTMQFYQVPYP